MAKISQSTLQETVTRIFVAAGLEQEKSDVVAECLIEADMIGHFTHGLALVPGYADVIQRGVITNAGEMRVVSDKGACVVWDGNQLPGAWLTAKAVDLAVERAQEFGICSVAIGRSQHNGALAAYLRRATDKGLMVQICCSTASDKWVAPFGGSKPLITPNPMAAGIPTDGDPILLDVSASITTVSMAHRMAHIGEKFDEDWVLDALGAPSKDPKDLTERGGSLMPLGGLSKGHKGFAMALLVEALSQGLSGFGRMGTPEEGSLSVYVQVSDPNAFGGGDEFRAQMGHLARICRENPPRPGVDAVRIPGDAAMAKWRAAKAQGVPLSQDILDGLNRKCREFSLPELVD